MKRRKLKNWVACVLAFNMFILLVLMGAECDNLLIFFISKVLFLVLFYINYIILDKYYISIS